MTPPHRLWPWASLGVTPLLPVVSLLPAGRFLFPLAAPLAVWALFSPAVKGGLYRRAVAVSLVWATLLSAGVILFSQVTPQLAGRSLLNAEPYRKEMFGWIQTGVGKENEPRRFLPEHALHLAAFLALTVASGGYLGLVLGAGLVGYMSYFVGTFALSAGAPVAGALVAWVPWSVVRVVAFVILGAVLARPVLTRQWSTAIGPVERRWIAWALLGILIDVALKTVLAPSYGRFLREFAGWSP